MNAKLFAVFSWQSFRIWLSSGAESRDFGIREIAATSETNDLKFGEKNDLAETLGSGGKDKAQW